MTFGWLDDYFPGPAGETTSRYPQLVEFEVLGRVTIEPVPVPADCTDRLARDLTDRSWHSRYASLLTLPEIDVGYRLVVAELG